MPKIMTANRLSDGIAVWLAADHSWAETIDGAYAAQSVACEEKITLAGKAAFLKNEVVDLALIDVDVIGGRYVPQRLRERIRAAGPTVRTDTGKQAEAGYREAA